MWVIMAVLVLFSILATRKMKDKPGVFLFLRGQQI